MSAVYITQNIDKNERSVYSSSTYPYPMIADAGEPRILLTGATATSVAVFSADSRKWSTLSAVWPTLPNACRGERAARERTSSATFSTRGVWRPPSLALTPPSTLSTRWGLRDDSRTRTVGRQSNFARAAERCGLKSIVYLGGLGSDDDLSPHLHSRQEVGAILGSSGVVTSEFRASCGLWPHMPGKHPPSHGCGSWHGASLPASCATTIRSRPVTPCGRSSAVFLSAATGKQSESGNAARRDTPLSMLECASCGTAAGCTTVFAWSPDAAPTPRHISECSIQFVRESASTDRELTCGAGSRSCAASGLAGSTNHSKHRPSC